MSLFKDAPTATNVESKYLKVCDQVREWKGQKALDYMIQMTGDAISNEDWYLSKVHPDSREQFKAFSEELIASEKPSDDNELPILDFDPVSNSEREDVQAWIRASIVGVSGAQTQYAQNIAFKYVDKIALAFQENKKLPTDAKWWIEENKTIGIFNAIDAVGCVYPERWT
jgi:hypothetical protein